ncbi:23S rRNA pseudouridine(2604) synthase RluF [Photobacterium sp. ZSDE20]|uniref:Pseudouridine synthase n=1 Tax=Photobacterium pectinilyticum TaxID=2906793 RepID=A0ABT1N4B9_9GAMM|nr:23S rRNA pseudouridine(2604) synthase RluF [Photobacterium sp. ZSDE20]MCQ1059595.1 23S rRNA pseudouridine(2604) synthase RluF [Photobacterium sp. ZSDE20]MDD1825458.1 23S rRNA pseudouridine(2604) synthase RluF [Photobacterium sp. ZSDE20]
MSQNQPNKGAANGEQSQAVRLNKFISDTGYCSRREADKLIDQGRVTVNGQEPEMGVKVMPGDDVLVDDKPLRAKEAPIYIALNKPAGITCTTERHIPDNIVDFIGHRKRIFPIGRLDKPSDGLIFLTNDGDIVNKILRAGNSHEKEYVVRVDKPITQEFIDKMASGVEILDTVTLPCKVTKETNYSFRIVLTQGLNRQIRRMCEALGYDVFKLRRVRIMNISIDGLPNGKWRYLTDAEIGEINSLIADSSKTEEASKVDGEGKNIKKATDAKLFDSRQQEGEGKIKYKTYQGKGEPNRRRHSGERSDRGDRRDDRRGGQGRGQGPNRGQGQDQDRQDERRSPRPGRGVQPGHRRTQRDDEASGSRNGSGSRNSNGGSSKIQKWKSPKGE